MIETRSHLWRIARLVKLDPPPFFQPHPLYYPANRKSPQFGCVPSLSLFSSTANKMMVNFAFEKLAHAVPLASARQRPENQKENQAGYSSERAVEGQLECGIALCS